MSLCLALTGKNAKEFGGAETVTEAVLAGIRNGIADGKFRMVTFDGKVTHLVKSANIDLGEISSHHYDFGDESVNEIKVTLIAGAWDEPDVELTHNDEPVVVELEY